MGNINCKRCFIRDAEKESEIKAASESDKNKIDDLKVIDIKETDPKTEINYFRT